MKYIIYGVICIAIVVYLLSFILKVTDTGRSDTKQAPFEIIKTIVGSLITLIIFVGIAICIYLFLTNLT